MATKNFPAKLRQLMRAKRYSQEGLGEKIGVSQNLVSLWTRGKSAPDYREMLAIARLLGVPAEYLMDDEMEEMPQPEVMPEDEKAILIVYRAQKKHPTQPMDQDEAIQLLGSRLVGPDMTGNPGASYAERKAAERKAAEKEEANRRERNNGTKSRPQGG